MKKLIDFLKENKISFEENVDGKRLCSFRVGGRAALVIKPSNTAEIKTLFGFLKNCKIRYILLGKGSNVVISDMGFDGAVILLSEIKSWSVEYDKLSIGAGASLSNAASVAQSFGLSGLEFAHGIPGSVGGGIYMNAGAYGGEICQVLSSCECYDTDTDEVVHLNNFDMGFSYRHSILQERKNLIILRATFDLTVSDCREVRDRMDVLRAQRLEKQPLEYPSAGSTFKRPEGYFAAKLIDDAGLKGYTVGGAQVSDKHAGFVINRGGATASDIKQLVDYIQKTVKEKFNVSLECEIEFVE